MASQRTVCVGPDEEQRKLELDLSELKVDSIRKELGDHSKRALYILPKSSCFIT